MYKKLDQGRENFENCSTMFDQRTQISKQVGVAKIPLRFSLNKSAPKGLSVICRKSTVGIDLLAILRKTLDRALFLYIFIHEVR